MQTLSPREGLIKELRNLPETLIRELYFYTQYLKYRRSKVKVTHEITIASENVLAKDWNKPEEEEAWKNL